ncbi:hypothetical protein ABBQ38_014802 [Trebouxia sp. C0009 RCD-2024]
MQVQLTKGSDWCKFFLSCIRNKYCRPQLTCKAVNNPKTIPESMLTYSMSDSIKPIKWSMNEPQEKHRQAQMIHIGVHGKQNLQHSVQSDDLYDAHWNLVS